MDEQAAFQEFMVRHVKEDPRRSVQRMLLWTEWVRFYLRKTRNFPQLVLEKNFDERIREHFGTRVALDDIRGEVYVGIKFVA